MTPNQSLQKLRNGIVAQESYIHHRGKTLTSDGRKYIIRDKARRVIFEHNLFLVALQELVK